MIWCKSLNSSINSRPDLFITEPIRRGPLAAGSGDAGGLDVLQTDRIIELRFTLDLLPAHPVDRDIHQDPIEPGEELRLAAEMVDAFPRLQERVLGKIPRVVFMSDHLVNH